MQGAPPLYATRRNPDLWSEGEQVGVIAKALGTPLIPWQQYVADVAGERRPNGEYEHQIVVVSVPRQTGKTTLLRAIGTHRAAVNGRDVFYTAQTGKDARARWEDLIKQVRLSPFRDMIRLSLRGGSETLWFGDVGFRVFAPTPESLHGYTPPLVLADEVMAHSESSGDLLMGAIGPAQFTIIDKQIWLVSTAGTAESVFLKKWLETALSGADRVAGFVWAAADEMDPFSVETIEAFHPAIGFELNGKTMTPSDVLVEADRNSRAEYERAYLNRWTVTASHLVPREDWNALTRNAPPPTDRTKAVLVYDVAYDQMSSSVVAVWHHDGRPHGKVLMAGPGVGWLVEAMLELRDEWRCPIAADDNGPGRDITDQLRSRGVDVEVTDNRTFVTATARFLNLIKAGGLSHDGGKLLADHVAGLATRVSNDGVALSRRHSTGDVSAATALTVGVWVLDHTPPPAQQPLIHFGGAA